jgi:rhodanese-related sulfurtransferase
MPDLGVTEAHRLWSEGALAIVDIREEPEHEVTRIAGVPLVPMSEILARLGELPTDRRLALICRSGARSGQVADYLNATGDHGDVANVEGGIIAWAAEGLPYEGDPPR